MFAYRTRQEDRWITYDVHRARVYGYLVTGTWRRRRGRVKRVPFVLFGFLFFFFFIDRFHPKPFVIAHVESPILRVTDVDKIISVTHSILIRRTEYCYH